VAQAVAAFLRRSAFASLVAPVWASEVDRTLAGQLQQDITQRNATISSLEKGNKAQQIPLTWREWFAPESAMPM